MIIVPKFGESNYEIKESLIDLIGSKIEIQMNTRDLEVSLNNCVKVIAYIQSFKNLDEIVFHMPFSLHTFELYVASKYHKSKLDYFIKRLSELSEKEKVNIAILMHQECSLELLETIPKGVYKVEEILNSIESNNVSMLVENCLPCLNAYDLSRITSFDLLNKIDHPKLNACIDVCHARCFETVLQKEFHIPLNLQDRVKWIHFACITNNDGYRDKTTHGNKHSSILHVKEDLKFLMQNGVDIDKVPIVSEVSEKDYTNMPLMIEEILLLRQVIDLK